MEPERRRDKVGTLATLDVLRAKPTRICPLECQPGYRGENETCVRIECRSAGFVAKAKKDDFERERQRKAKTAFLSVLRIYQAR
jgi:hypothetical protein